MDFGEALKALREGKSVRRGRLEWEEQPPDGSGGNPFNMKNVGGQQ